MMTVPAPVMDTVLAESVAGPETRLKTTGSPDEAVALNAKGPSPYALSDSGPKVMVWPAAWNGMMVTV